MVRPAILVDRDGTLIVEKHYLADPAQVVLEQNAAAGLRRLAEAGYALVVVSNQSGIGRGYFSEADAIRVNQRVSELLAREGVSLAAIYFCPHSPDAPCNCRKPLPGMAHRAAEELGIDLQASYVIGDKKSDLEFARAAGATGLLVATGYGSHDTGWALQQGYAVCRDLADAAHYILSR